MRVKAFEKMSLKKLENEINKWLEENPQITVIDLWYQYGRGVTNSYSAMILYQEEDE